MNDVATASLQMTHIQVVTARTARLETAFAGRQRYGGDRAQSLIHPKTVALRIKAMELGPV